MSSITILARSTTTPSRTSSLPRVAEPTGRAPELPGKPRHWWHRRHDEGTELSPRVIDLQIRSVALWPRSYR